MTISRTSGRLPLLIFLHTWCAVCYFQTKINIYVTTFSLFSYTANTKHILYSFIIIITSINTNIHISGRSRSLFFFLECMLENAHEKIRAYNTIKKLLMIYIFLFYLTRMDKEEEENCIHMDWKVDNSRQIFRTARLFLIIILLFAIAKAEKSISTLCE